MPPEKGKEHEGTTEEHHEEEQNPVTSAETKKTEEKPEEENRIPKARLDEEIAKKHELEQQLTDLKAWKETKEAEELSKEERLVKERDEIAKERDEAILRAREARAVAEAAAGGWANPAEAAKLIDWKNVEDDLSNLSDVVAKYAEKNSHVLKKVTPPGVNPGERGDPEKKYTVKTREQFQKMSSDEINEAFREGRIDPKIL